MKEATKNSYNEAINRVVDYVNIHLKEEINLPAISEVANLSEFHFHRIFKAFIGESLGSYVNRIRLERAAQLLQTSQKTLEQIAEIVGYSTPFSFSKAFKKHFGVAPTTFRNTQPFFPIKEEMRTHPLMELKWEKRSVEELEILYLRISGEYGVAVNYDEAWNSLIRFGNENRLINERTQYIGISHDDPGLTTADKRRFYACITVAPSTKPKGPFGRLKLEAGDYAVFTLKGSYKQLETYYQSVFFSWLPASGYHLRNAHLFEKYLNSPDEVEASDLLTEIYIPIGKNDDKF